MKTAGIIGLGKMGHSLLQGFMNASVLTPKGVKVFDLNVERMEKVQNKWPGIEAGTSAKELAGTVDLLFIVVEPKDVLGVLMDIGDSLKPETHVISLAACVTLPNIHLIIPAYITKVIPAILFKYREGVSLICHHENVPAEKARYVEELFEGVSAIRVIEEDDFEPVANITSVGPALFSSLAEEVVSTGMENSKLTRREAENLAFLTLKGVVKMLEEEELSFGELVDQVATKGGITEAGIKVIRSEMPALMSDFFSITLAKHEEIKDLLGKDYRAAENFKED